MAWVLALYPEVFRRLDQTQTKYSLPKPVDGHPGSQGMFRISQPIGQTDAVDRPLLFPTPDDLGNGRLEFF